MQNSARAHTKFLSFDLKQCQSCQHPFLLPPCVCQWSLTTTIQERLMATLCFPHHCLLRDGNIQLSWIVISRDWIQIQCNRMEILQGLEIKKMTIREQTKSHNVRKNARAKLGQRINCCVLCKENCSQVSMGTLTTTAEPPWNGKARIS